jgi:hypothetical protein
MASMSPTGDPHDVVGQIGRVTGRVARGTIGEVMLPVRGGVEAFYAYPADPDEVIEAGSRALVVDYEPPRTVTVTVYEE